MAQCVAPCAATVRAGVFARSPSRCAARRSPPSSSPSVAAVLAQPRAATRRQGLAARKSAVSSRRVFSVAASAGSCTVGTGNGGLEMATLKGTDGSVAEVYSYGGVCTSWVKDGRDVLYVRPDAKFDKSKPISGGIPHCWPQFGPGNIQVRPTVLWTSGSSKASGLHTGRPNQAASIGCSWTPLSA